ncbi:MAG TPA: Rieske (2Fe-2S) protein [Pseudonocardia sp.]|nr:Rieske (2Fe-2S) protein [Pseudonocardia sp.]
MRPFSDIERLERAQVLDKPAGALRKAVQSLVSSPQVKDALHGVWLGHPLHPALAQVTLGSLLSASMIDAVRGRRGYSTGLILAGLLSTPATAAAGATDWSQANPDQQRVGLVHAATNAVASACYIAALSQRARGRGGRLLSVLGGAVSAVGATLGGHLGYRQAMGANHADRVIDLAPAEWRPIGPLTDLPDGRPVRRDAGEVAVLVLRRGDDVVVLADRCPHLAAPLHEGSLAGADGDARIVCPWHGSEFRLTDGCVLHGPATAPAPAFDTRTVGGELQVRLRPAG